MPLHSKHTIVYYSNLVVEDVLSKINPDNGVEAIKGMQDATLTSLLAGDRMVRLLETSTASKNNYSVTS
jgi:hypothetical protein